MRNPKNFAIKTRNLFESQQVIAYMKSLGIDVRHNNGRKCYANRFYCVDNGEFAIKKDLVDFQHLELCDFATEIPVKLFVKGEIFEYRLKRSGNHVEKMTHKHSGGRVKGKVYPKKYPREMMVSDNGTSPIKSMVIGEVTMPNEKKLYLVPNGDNTDVFTFAHATEMPKVVELTLEQIAKRFKCNVSDLRIKD